MDTAIRTFYYFAANETPPPMPPLKAGIPATVVCHDQILNPGSDSVLYPRFQLIPQHFTMWDKADQRFATVAGKMNINKIIETRLVNEFGINEPQNLFQLLKWFNRPTVNTTTTTFPMGFIMASIPDPISLKSSCPTRQDFLTSTEPRIRILRDYIDSTEALYVAEKEPETGVSGNIVFPSMFITESVIKKYGFYIENGLKIRADQAALESKTIHYYWPVNTSMDPLQAGGDRKLFTVKYPNMLGGQEGGGVLPADPTTDKRLGCVPTTSLP
jgi:hypothetical protein